MLCFYFYSVCSLVCLFYFEDTFVNYKQCCWGVICIQRDQFIIPEKSDLIYSIFLSDSDSF